MSQITGYPVLLRLRWSVGQGQWLSLSVANRSRYGCRLFSYSAKLLFLLDNYTYSIKMHYVNCCFVRQGVNLVTIHLLSN